MEMSAADSSSGLARVAVLIDRVAVADAEAEAVDSPVKEPMELAGAEVVACALPVEGPVVKVPEAVAVAEAVAVQDRLMQGSQSVGSVTIMTRPSLPPSPAPPPAL